MNENTIKMLKTLYEKDPKRFETVTRKLIEDFINKASEESKPSLIVLQSQIDSLLGVSTPLERCRTMNEFCIKYLENLEEHITDLSKSVPD